MNKVLAIVEYIVDSRFVCTCQMNLFAMMKNYFCGKVNCLLSSTYQTRDHFFVYFGSKGIITEEGKAM